jgi:predicted kinase
MSKVVLTKPILICLYGFPGSGKTYVAHKLTESVQIAHVSADRIRAELFQTPRYDTQENAVISHLMSYMTEEFLNSGVSVIYDAGVPRIAQRRRLRELARHFKAELLLIWLQIDAQSAFARTQNRDRRTSIDKFAQPYTQETFNATIAAMQNPNDEDYLVISGKHNFTTQKGAIINRLYQMGLASSDQVQHNVTKPELINLIPNPLAGRVNLNRRNISIR